MISFALSLLAQNYASHWGVSVLYENILIIYAVLKPFTHLLNCIRMLVFQRVSNGYPYGPWYFNLIASFYDEIWCFEPVVWRFFLQISLTLIFILGPIVFILHAFCLSWEDYWRFKTSICLIAHFYFLIYYHKNAYHPATTPKFMQFSRKQRMNKFIKTI